MALPKLSAWEVIAFSKFSRIVKATFPTEGHAFHVGGPCLYVVPWEPPTGKRSISRSVKQMWTLRLRRGAEHLKSVPQIMVKHTIRQDGPHFGVTESET